MDTIFAQATAKGKAGVAIIRISGPRAFTVVETLGGSVPPPHRSALRVLRDQAGGVLDEALVIAFPTGHSFTGEETVELQVHGSVAIVAALEREIAALDGLRMAEPGEFTRRALENNRLDLAQVEGLADLVEAETEAQRKQAQRVFSGALGARVAGWRDDLVRAAALLEVTIDFADEEVPVDVTPEVRTLIERVLTDLRAEIAGARVAERIRSGFEVAILGAPNAGKSSLLNYLAGREAAITSSIAGTTRDVIEVRMDLGGMPVTLLDTAGIRETGDEIERIGVSRALDRAAAADLRVVLTETGALPEGLGSLTPEITVLSKRDLHGDGLDGISVTTGQGIDLLVDRIAELLSQRMQGVGTATRDRHRLAMERAADQLDATLDALEAGVATELLAEDLRAAIRALDSLIGRVDVDHLLGEIFASFCIGK